MPKFPYNWTLKDAIFTKDKGKVFSCLAGGGGSSMGYKLAGFDVIGCNEIDKRMMYAYCQNHDPKYPYLKPLQFCRTIASLRLWYECTTGNGCTNSKPDMGTMAFNH